MKPTRLWLLTFLSFFVTFGLIGCGGGSRTALDQGTNEVLEHAFPTAQREQEVNTSPSQGMPSSRAERVAVTKASSPVMLGEDVPIDEPGTYVLEVSSRRVWNIGMVREQFVWSPVDATFVTFGESGLVVTDLQSSSSMRIHEGDVLDAAWSSDGREVAFIVDFEGRTRGVYLAAMDGSYGRKLSDISDIDAISWSPQGDRLALFATNGDVYLHDIVSGNTTTLTTLSGQIKPDQFSWSPDGQLVAIGTANGLQILSSDTTQRKYLTSRPADRLAMWSPNASGILTAESVSGHDRAMIVSLVDSVHGISEWPWAVAFEKPTWSPDGKRFAYVSDGCTSGAFDLYIMTDNGKRRQRTQSQQVKLRPLWSPVNSDIVFSTTDKLVLVDADSTGEVTLVERSAQVLDALVPIGWSRDGRYIAFYVAGGHGVCD